MFNILQFYEAGKARSGTAYFPFMDTPTVNLYVSTRFQNTEIIYADAVVNATAPKLLNYAFNPNGEGLNAHTHTTPFTGNVSVIFKGGLKDVYSLMLGGYNVFTGRSAYNIIDFGAFLRQFPNLFSFAVYIQSSGTEGFSTIKGNYLDIPDSVEEILVYQAQVTNWEDFYIDFSALKTTSKLRRFYKRLNYNQFDSSEKTAKITGDISKLPISCNYFFIDATDADANAFATFTNSKITYTAGKVWASAFDTLSIPLVLSQTELDALLADMDGSINTKIGAGVIAVGGYRSYASDAHVASLQAKGFTVNINKQLGLSILDSSVIFRADFQNNFDVYSNSYLGAIAGGTSNQPTFALSGRKAGEYCAVFNGSQSIKTTTNLPVNSDKVTIAFWMKTTQTGGVIVGEMSTNTNLNNTFSWYINDSVANSVQFNSRNTGENKSARTGANNGTWKHFVAVIDRAQNGANEILIYENGVLATFTKPISNDNNGNFVNNILFIGQRGGSSSGFNGSLTKLKIYNYPFTASEVSNLYNSEL